MCELCGMLDPDEERWDKPAPGSLNEMLELLGSVFRLPEDDDMETTT